VDARRRALILVATRQRRRGADVSFHDLLISGARVISARYPYPCLFPIVTCESGVRPVSQPLVLHPYFGSGFVALFRLPRRLQCSQDRCFCTRASFSEVWQIFEEVCRVAAQSVQSVSSERTSWLS
jgi:hypothetical protein